MLASSILYSTCSVICKLCMMCSMYQHALNEDREVLLQAHDHNEGEEADDVDEAATQPGDVSLVEEGADEEADGQDAQGVVTQVEEENEAVTLGKNSAGFQDDGQDDNSDQEERSALYEPGHEMAERIHTHHLHVLRRKYASL